MTSEIPASEAESFQHELWQWTGILGPPIAWLLHFQINYALVPHVCATHNHITLHLTSIFFLAASIASGVLAWSLLRQPVAPEQAMEVETMFDRPRFMAQVGMMMSVLFTLIIISQWIACFMIDPCMD